MAALKQEIACSLVPLINTHKQAALCIITCNVDNILFAAVMLKYCTKLRCIRQQRNYAATRPVCEVSCDDIWLSLGLLQPTANSLQQHTRHKVTYCSANLMLPFLAKHKTFAKYQTTLSQMHHHTSGQTGHDTLVCCTDSSAFAQDLDG